MYGQWQPTPVFLPGESHGQRSLVGYSPRGRKESDTTERLHFTLLYYGPMGSVQCTVATLIFMIVIISGVLDMGD